MTLRPEYSLGHSAYNDFLFTPLGHDAAGTELTVLSALTRLGLDPWQEAARLADLPRAAAAAALAVVIARLPGVGPQGAEGGSWTAAEAASVAQRLVATLPEGRAPAIPETPEARASARPPGDGMPGSGPTRGQSREPARRAGPATWLVWGGVALAFYLLVVQMTPDRQFEPPAAAPAAAATTRQ